MLIRARGELAGIASAPSVCALLSQAPMRSRSTLCRRKLEKALTTFLSERGRRHSDELVP